ncbi:MAG: AarF/ABC1/UbiB kinase family protein [Candidatus Wallbacteria bacterium]|nr:AarF/ABC1/UbiB kinase family protein [Candidatus Wallbacteria bacterium]MBI4866190.1 AarF/ABC1/UbiB kinase family protein [Candidatus Wallbacteria bacterium]
MINLKSIRSIPRIGDITAVLVRHGLEHFAEQLGLPIYQKLRTLISGPPGLELQSTLPERLRNVLQDLGPTFIKFGQVLSTRHDLIPEDFIREFSQLQDHVPPMPYERVAAVLESELSQPPEKLFRDIEHEAIAAASIGQVHRAHLPDGRQVVLKVQREGISDIIRSDIDILYYLAHTLQTSELLEASTFDPVGIIGEFARSITRELDYVREAQNMVTFRRNFADTPRVRIPEVYLDLCTHRVLVMEYMRGTRGNRIDPKTVNGKALAEIGARAVLQQVFKDGCFHADPHPGNILILDGNTICFLDFGMVGRLSLKMKDNISRLLVSLIGRDYDALARELVYVGEPVQEIDLDRFSTALMDTLDPFYGVALKNLDLGLLIRSIMKLLVQHQLKLPSNYAMMLKALISIEHMAKTLDPEFDIIQEARPFVEELVIERWHPQRLMKDAHLGLLDFASFMKRTPSQLTKLLHKMQHGNFSIEFMHRGLDPLSHTLDKLSNRISFSLVISALIIGSSFIMTTNIQPTMFGYPWMGVCGYMAAGFLGFWLAIGILRSGRL